MFRLSILLGLVSIVCYLGAGASWQSRSGHGQGHESGRLEWSHGKHILASGYNGTVYSLKYIPPSTLKHVAEPLKVGDSPSWITFSRRGKHAYVTDESVPGKVFLVGVERNGALRHLGRSEGYGTGGDGPVASCLVERCLFIANYNSGSLGVQRILKESKGALKLHAEAVKHFQFERNGTGPVTTRQDHSYAHDAVVSPDGAWVYVPDLGADVIHRIRVNTKSCKESRESGKTTVDQGSGPRHLAFYRDDESGKQFAYLSSELATTLTAFRHHPKTGHLDLIGGQPVAAYPPGTKLGGSKEDGPQQTVAEVTVSPDGRFVYVSNRGDATEDHISIFLRNRQTGAVTFQQWVPSGGQNPRHFSLSSDGHYLAVANQQSTNVVIFRRDSETGMLEKTGAEVDDVGAVAFAGFVP